MATESKPGTTYGPSNPGSTGPITINPNDYIGATNSYPGQRRPTSAADLAQGPMMAKAYNYGLAQYPNDPVKASLASVDYRYQNDPTYKLPSGFKIENGHVVVDNGSWLSNNWGYLILAAAGGAIGLATLASFAPEAATTLATAATDAGVPASEVTATGAGVGIGETAATTGLASGAGIPGLTAAPVLGDSAATSGIITGDGIGATYGSTPITPPTTPPTTSSSLTGDLLKYGLPTAGGIVGGLIQANAAGKASDAQTAYLNQALQYAEAKDAYSRDLEGSRYATYSSNIAPYVANGATATSKMASLLGLPATNTPAPSVAPPPTFTGPTGAPPATAPTTTSGPQAVTMRAPDGSTRQVAAADVAAAQAKGAQVVS